MTTFDKDHFKAWLEGLPDDQTFQMLDCRHCVMAAYSTAIGGDGWASGNMRRLTGPDGDVDLPSILPDRLLGHSWEAAERPNASFIRGLLGGWL